MKSISRHFEASPELPREDRNRVLLLLGAVLALGVAVNLIALLRSF